MSFDEFDYVVVGGGSAGWDITMDDILAQREGRAEQGVQAGIAAGEDGDLGETRAREPRGRKSL